MLNAFLIAFVLSFLLNLSLTPLGKKIRSFRAQAQDGSLGLSKIGGIAIAVSFFTAVLFFLESLYSFDRRIVMVLAALAATFLLGLLDDLLRLSVFKKIGAQSAISLFLVFAGIKTQIILLPPFLNICVTVLWFLALMNAFNFLDVLDGLAAGISVVCAATFLYLCHATGNPAAGILAAALLGGNLAFLKFNLYPARLYMGDTGSLFNGMALGIIAIMISYAPKGREAALFVPLLVLALPLYDLFFVVVTRLASGKSIVRKSRDHFVLRLVDRGNGLSRAVMLMYFFCVLFNGAALFLFHASNTVGFFILFLAVSSWLLMAYKISGKVRANELRK